MDKETALDVIDQFLKMLDQKGVHVQKAILFGSYATGQFHDGSDIDLVIISEQFLDMNHLERLETFIDVLYKLWKPLEVIPMTPDEWEKGDSLIVEFAKNGEVVHGTN